MNKHLLQTRLKSILHYQEEIRKLEEAKVITHGTLNECLNALVEFWPYSEGDVLVIGKKMLRVRRLKGISRPQNPSFEFSYDNPADTYGKFEWKESQYTYDLAIADLDKVKIIDASTFE